MRMSAAALAGLAVVATPVLAQNPSPSATTTRPIEVTAPPVPTPTSPSLDDAREEIRRVPGGANVVPSEDFRLGGAVSLRDMLGFTPGVYAQQRWGEEVRLSIRGSGIATNNHLFGVRVLQDGIPFNLADGSGDFQEIDPLNIRYLEVFRGANALQYGATTLGGAINAVSPTGRSAPGLLGRAEIGTDGYHRVQAAAGGSKGGWDYYLSPTRSGYSGARPESDSQNTRFAGNVGYRLGDLAETRFFLFANRIQQRIPGALTRAQWDASQSQPAAANVTARAARNIESFRVANRTAFVLGPTEVVVSAYATDRFLFHPLSFGIVDNNTNDYGGQIRTATDSEIGGFRNRFVAGTGVAYGTNDARTFQNNRGYRGNLTRFAYQRAINVDVFVENQFYVLSDVALVAGAQALTADRRSEDRFNANRADSGQKRYNALNPKAGVLWDFSRDTQVYGNVSRSYQPPRFSDVNPSAAVGWTDLAAQYGTTAEIGTRGRYADIGFDASVYRSWLRKELLVYDIGGGQTQTQNADRTIHQGFELGFDAPVARALFRAPGAETDTLRWRQVYTYSDFRFDGDRQFRNNRLPVVPMHVLRTELRYDSGEGLYVAPNLEWVPQAANVDSTNSRRGEPYMILGARAGYKVNGNVDLFFEGKNLTNRSYIADVTTTSSATAATAFINPGLRRLLLAGVEARW